MVDMWYGRLPVDRGSITGRWLQSDNGWTPDHPHLGVDYGFPAALGDPIYWVGPSGRARVHHPGDGWGDGSFGNCVVLDHRAPCLWYTLLAHMSEVLVADGAECKEGDIIGKLGFSGAVDPPGPAGAHCHWQMCTDAGFPRDVSKGANPLDFLGVQPVPPAPAPLTLDQVLAQAQSAAAQAQANRDEIVSLNSALMLRWKLEGLSRDPDLARVQSAVAILRERGFNL